jgi:hypothetical protein
MGIGKPRTINPKCRVCGEVLTEKNWYWYFNESRDHISLICKTCWCKRKRDWNKNNPLKAKAITHRAHLNHKEEDREKNYLRSYGITIKDYNELFLKQDGKCAVCGSETVGRKTDKNFIIDHDHKTGKVRGLLCHKCNAILGMAQDNIKIFEEAIEYLRRT